MASYNELNALIDAYINRNGVQAITGQILNGVLKAMVEQLGRGYTIMGAATPETDPGTPDGPECYFASETGTYTDFDGLQVVPGELALLCYTPTDGWTKATIYEGFQEVQATIDGNVGTPSVGVSYANGVLSFDFHNMKGNPGQDGQDGQDGDPAGFGTIGADITGGVGTPGVTVESSGPATAKNVQFHFTNLKGETGVTSVIATVDNTTGTPACAVSLNGQELHLDFTGLKGAQGNTGVSADYPITIVNNLTDGGAASALSAEMGKQLEAEVSQLELKVDEMNGAIKYSPDNLSPSETGKYIYNSGQIFGGQSANVSGLISLGVGKTITVIIVTELNTSTAVIAQKKEGSGAPYYASNTGKSVLYQSGVKVYSYTATEDCQVAISYKASDGFVALVQGKTISQKFAEIDGQIENLDERIDGVEVAKTEIDGYATEEVEVAQNNKAFHYSYTDLQDATGFCYSKPFYLNKGDKITLSLVGGTPNATYAAIAVVLVENSRFKQVVRQDSATFTYEWEADYSCRVSVCYPSASTATVVVKRISIPEHIERIDANEPIIIAPFHAESADGEDGNINAETITVSALDAIAQKTVKNYPGVLSSEVMGKDASGVYDITRYTFVIRDYCAYKHSDGLFAWKSASDALVYTKHYCPVPGDDVFDNSETVLGTVSSFNSTDGEMSYGGDTYTRSKTDNIAPDIIYTKYDLADYYKRYTTLVTYTYKGIFDGNKLQIGTFAVTDFNTSTGVLTYNAKEYTRCKSFDYGENTEHTIVLWGNEHAPQSDPLEPCLTLLKMMQDIASSTADDNPLMRYLKYNCKVVFVPLVNPWGVERHLSTPSYDGRTNYNGVNINRNYDYKWESVAGSQLKGTNPGDQPETRYMMDTCAILGADLALDIHCLGYVAGNYDNGICYDAVLPDEGIIYFEQEMAKSYGMFLGKIGNGDGDAPGEGPGFICKNLQIGGGLIEMNAGTNGVDVHCAGKMQMNYDYLLKAIRFFFKITAPNLYITR